MEGAKCDAIIDHGSKTSIALFVTKFVVLEVISKTSAGFPKAKNI